MASRRFKTLSAGVVPVRYTPAGEPQVLLLRAWRHWDFPKGGVEAGEQPLEAAIREVEEETGITDLEFRWGTQSIDTGPYGHGKVSRYHVAVTNETHVVLPVNPELGRPEHHEFRWCRPAQAERLVTPRVLNVLRWAYRVAGITDAGADAPSDRDHDSSAVDRPRAGDGQAGPR
jgi:bis(5'-nucleosidyl)-tetraphosphatase